MEDHQNFVATLESFRELKSGISGSRIKKLTTYALEHVADEEKLISLIIDYSKTCAPTHKLGSLYIIDSIGRAYLDEARANDEYVKPTAKKGTCAHAIYVLGESIQGLLTDAIGKSNEDHREKIRTLIDIWDRAGLFQKGYLNAIRAKCFSMAITDEDSRNSSVSSVQQLPVDPKERCLHILNDLRPLRMTPQVVIPQELASKDITQQQQALFQLLVSIQQQLAPDAAAAQSTIPTVGLAQAPLSSQVPAPAQGSVSQPPTAAPPTAHVTTEYGSRRERERERDRFHRRNRSRSPPARRDGGTAGGTNNHHLYPDEQNVPSNSHFRPKPVSFDPTTPPEHIKVYSRTLFVGGVPMNMKEWDIASVLRPYAEVQSVILNNSRKHAFVKVYSRQEAENVLLNFNKDGSSPLRTRWGVGFGPRDCCDYQHGYSIIPMHRLTDADKKWCVQAQWGGTGGQPLQGGIVFEEPDIVVGEGVSSKAISQKMPTDSGRNGPRSGKGNRGSVSVSPPMPKYGVAPVPSPGQMYNQIPSTYPAPQQVPYGGAPMQGTPQVSSAYPPPPSQQPASAPSPPQQSFDPTAQLNSLMSMLNQQQSQ
ncbi:related to Protein NRD1 [Zygosaccharomyces bailii ISA1307]|nr:related to Protein NRD1 [Zygosaccharomyces bailii ISA1307]